MFIKHEKNTCTAWWVLHTGVFRRHRRHRRRVASRRHDNAGLRVVLADREGEIAYANRENAADLIRSTAFPVWFTSYFIPFYVTHIKAPLRVNILSFIHYFCQAICYSGRHTRHSRIPAP